MHIGHPIPSYLITLVVVAGVVFLRARRMLASRRMQPRAMWVLPAIVSVAAVFMLATFPPHGLDWLWLALALVVGAGFGWLWGRFTRITVDPVTRQMDMRASPLAIVFLVLIVGVRLAARAMLTEASSLHVATALVTDGLALFAVGLLVVSRLEMTLRSRRLLGEVVASTFGGPPERPVGVARRPWS